MQRREIVLPDFDLPGVQVLLSAWLVAVGDRVVEGDRLIEISAGEAVIDLESPATGILAEKLADVDDQLRVGQVLGIVVTRE